MATRTLPYAWYDDPAVLRVEQERIFARSWQYATRADAVAEPGSMTPAWAGSLPVLVVRAHDGRLRGFVNVCRHRGHVLCEASARRETIQCPYHAWTYGLDGKLLDWLYDQARKVNGLRREDEEAAAKNSVSGGSDAIGSSSPPDSAAASENAKSG